jgi:hypothetical protein
MNPLLFAQIRLLRKQLLQVLAAQEGDVFLDSVAVGVRGMLGKWWALLSAATCDENSLS